VLLPQQDLSAGTLHMALVPGVIGELRFADPDTRGTWKSAFPARSGDLLNLRDLEQGLEQMKRVASQDADMQVVPTQVPGVSDVVITVKRGKPWTVVASVDNSGTHATGKWLGNLSVSLDNPLGLNDLFNVGYMQDLAFGDRQHGTHGWNGFYSVPWSYWTATLAAYTGRGGRCNGFVKGDDIERTQPQAAGLAGEGVAEQPEAATATDLDVQGRGDAMRAVSELADLAEGKRFGHQGLPVLAYKICPQFAYKAGADFSAQLETRLHSST